MQVSHTPHRLDIAFDDGKLVAHAGLSLTSQLAARLGMRKLIRERLQLGHGIPGAAHADLKAMTLISALLAGAECIDDVDLLRSGATASVIVSMAMPRRASSRARCILRRSDSVGLLMLGISDPTKYKCA